MTEGIGPPPTGDEARDLIRLLARYCDHDLDQWDTWRLAMPWSDVHVTITSALPPEMPHEAFTRVWPFPPKLAQPAPGAAAPAAEPPSA